MQTADFDYSLPPELIAQTPLATRDQSRLLVLRRADGSLDHHRFFELPDFLREGDLLVRNDSRVMPARLSARRTGTGGRLEILLLRRVAANVWETLVRPAKRVRAGERIEVVAGPGCPNGRAVAEVLEERERGIRVLAFTDDRALAGLGTIALPPYIHHPLDDPERYQTVYADAEGSVAAPTAGLHFTPELLAALRCKGVETVSVTLHIGLDTFRPVETCDPRQHEIHSEYGVITPEAASKLSRARAEGRRIICVGTTSVRLIEAASGAAGSEAFQPFAGWVDLFILSGYRFRMVDAMITNFHLPRSTLLMLVAAFAGRESVLHAYREAARLGYRFYSFGDAMLIA